MRGSVSILVLLTLVVILAPGQDAKVWGQSNDSGVVENLIKDLSDNSWQIRWYAVTGLGDRKEKSALEHLTATLKNDENTYVRGDNGLGSGRDRRRPRRGASDSGPWMMKVTASKRMRYWRSRP